MRLRCISSSAASVVATMPQPTKTVQNPRRSRLQKVAHYRLVSSRFPPYPGPLKSQVKSSLDLTRSFFTASSMPFLLAPWLLGPSSYKQTWLQHEQACDIIVENLLHEQACDIRRQEACMSARINSRIYQGRACLYPQSTNVPRVYPSEQRKSGRKKVTLKVTSYLLFSVHHTEGSEGSVESLLGKIGSCFMTKPSK